MRWARNVARVGDIRYAYRASIGKYEGKCQLGKPRRNGMIKLKCIFKKKNVRKWTRLTGFMIRACGRIFKSAYETLGSENCGEFLYSRGTICLCCIQLVTLDWCVVSICNLTDISGDSPEGSNGFITQDISCILQKPKFYSPNS